LSLLSIGLADIEIW